MSTGTMLSHYNDDNDDVQFVSLYSSLMYIYGMAQCAELRQHNYFMLVVRKGVKQYFMVLGQAHFVSFTPWQHYFHYFHYTMAVMW